RWKRRSAKATSERARRPARPRSPGLAHRCPPPAACAIAAPRWRCTIGDDRMNSVASDLYRRTGDFADDVPHVPVKGARAAGPGADIVRMIACGSVDDGKSTLIGRLLHEAGRVTDDERAALARASASHGTRGGDIDYALLLDGLDAEREQGITID